MYIQMSNHWELLKRHKREGTITEMVINAIVINRVGNDLSEDSIELLSKLGASSSLELTPAQLLEMDAKAASIKASLKRAAETARVGGSDVKAKKKRKSKKGSQEEATGGDSIEEEPLVVADA